MAFCDFNYYVYKCVNIYLSVVCGNDEEMKEDILDDWDFGVFIIGFAWMLFVFMFVVMFGINIGDDNIDADCNLSILSFLNFEADSKISSCNLLLYKFYNLNFLLFNLSLL